MDGVAWKDYGTGSFHSRAFNKDDESETTEWVIVHYLCSYFADYGSEKVLKKLAGRADVEDALSRLDSLTREETLIAVAKNLEISHSVDRNVTEINVLAEDTDGNVKKIKVLSENIDGKVQATGRAIERMEKVTDDVDQNVKVAKERTQWFPPSLFI
jgi:carbon monoxide dehydrogenase subunit G